MRNGGNGMEDEIHVPTKKLTPDEADKLAREYGGYVHPGLKAVVLPALVSHDYREQQLVDRIIAALEDPSVEFETIDRMIDELAELWKLGN